MVLFPKERIFNQVAQASQASTVSTFFLDNLLKAKPDDEDLRFLLARHQLEIGQVQKAKETVSSILSSQNPDVWLRAHLLNLRILEIQTFAFFEGTQTRRDGLRQMGQHIETILQQTSEPDPHMLTQLAQSALKAGHQNLARSIYERLGQQSEPYTEEWYAKAAELALGQGDYQKAADLYFSAQRQSTSRSKQRTYYLAALRTLQSGNFLKEALQQANAHIGGLKNDESTLFFLVSLGRAAGDGAFAEKYVKDLLRVSLVSPQAEVRSVGLSPWMSKGDKPFVFAPLLSEVNDAAYARVWDSGRPVFLFPSMRNDPSSSIRPVSTTARTFRPFDDRIYQLGYTVFLENQNLKDAYKLAEAAVQQVPNQLAWRKRLAQVAEWTGRPTVALAQWRAMAERKPEQNTFEQILRLAPGAYDDENIIFAFLGLEKYRPLSDAEWRKLSEAYERIGKPEEAIAYLLHLHRQKPRQTLLEQVANLYQRMGEGEKASGYYRVLKEQYGSTLAWTTQEAALLSSRGDIRGAYDLMKGAKEQASNENHEYWKLVGHLAWMVEDDEQAEEAYRVLWNQKVLSMESHERLIVLVGPTRPEEAIELSLAGWQIHHSPKFFLQALDLLLQQKNIKQLHATLEGLLSWEEDLVAHDPRYWIVRAEVMWKIGKKSEAHHAYERALALSPDSLETQEAYLWFLVDQKNLRGLKTYLHKWDAAIQSDSRLWGPVAAAYVVLDQPEKSLPFFLKQLKKKKNDYLWLLNYAFALEASSKTALAWQVRQHAWIVLRQSLFKQPSRTVSPETLEAYATLASTNAPGDPLLALLMQLRSNMTTPVMKELVMSWFLSQEAFEAAKTWLWKNYAQYLGGPGWGQLAIALAENNWEAVDAIVHAKADHLSISDKVEAANRLERKTLAQTLAFDELTQQPDNQTVYAQYQEAIQNAANKITSRVMLEERSPLLSHESKTSMPVQVGRIEVKPEVSAIWQESTDSSELTGVPRIDRQVGVSVGYRAPDSLFRLAGFHRNALSTVFGVGMEYQQNWNDHFSTQFILGRNQKADDSVLLQIGGVKDFIMGQGLYYFSKRQFVSLQIDAPWFLSQSRKDLGHGLGVEGVVGHHVRKEYPDLTVRLVGTVQRYWRENTLPGGISRLIPNTQTPSAKLVVPESFAQGGFNLSLGDSIRDVYTKGIRPFGLLGMNYNSTTGFGHSIEAGLAARLFGQDRLLVYGSNIRGGFGQNATTTRLNVEYQRWF